jgi:hypothetical protein
VVPTFQTCQQTLTNPSQNIFPHTFRKKTPEKEMGAIFDIQKAKKYKEYYVG